MEEVRSGRIDCLEDVSEEELGKVVLELEKSKKRDQKYLAEARKRARLQEPHVARNICGQTVFIQHGVYPDNIAAQRACGHQNLVSSPMQDWLA